MKLIRNRGSRRSAFTMVELALCIAVVAIAMVAIIGVLPAGLGVQKQNREETIIDQDATLLMEAIRSGATGFDDLTNYVDFVIVTNQPFNSGSFSTYAYKGPLFKWPNSSVPTVLEFPQQVLGLLSLPQTDYSPQGKNPVGRTNQNWVVAQFRAFSGALNEKVLPQQRGDLMADAKLDQAFRYRLNVEIVPIFSHPTNQMDAANLFQQRVLANTLYDVRLTFQWPVFGNSIPAEVGGNVKSYRTQVSGRLSRVQIPLLGTNDVFAPNTDIYLRRFVPDVTTPPAALSAYQPKP
jgi:type II secretory pathway pseudopilin PulG